VKSAEAIEQARDKLHGCAKERCEEQRERGQTRQSRTPNPSPCFFVSIDSKGVAKLISASIHSKRVKGILREAEKMVGRREAKEKRRASHNIGYHR
jgi:hypothetical protein